MHSLVISIYSVCLSIRDVGERTKAFEMRCYLRVINISYKDHVISEDMGRQIQAATQEYDELLTLFQKQQLRIL